MADPKFANLPGIAYDQPDIYETPDIPEPDTSDYYEEEPENESIERPHLSAKSSYGKFKGKHLEGNVDFSDRLSRRIRTGYDAWSDEYELAADGEKENPFQKCRRLQCEINSLIEEISVLQADKKVTQEEKESYEAVSTVVNTAKKILDSLHLEQVLGKEEVSSSADKEVRNLITQVEEFKKSGVLTPIPPQGRNLADSSRIATLEHKLHEIEQLIGTKPDKISRLKASLGTSSVLEAVQQLSTKAALLQPNQLDLIEARLTALATKMDSIAEKTSGSSQDSQRDAKVLELYDIAKKTEPVAQILPDILERMQALESLHKYATNFTSIIAELEATQKGIISGISNNKTLLQGVQEAFALNLENVNTEVAKLQERISKLTAECEKLKN
uniref:Putative dynamitin n=1 Tax=Tabanus bromius TaxID=304241 RepID=A0A0K8TMC0_TABBR